jgi:hypothetical protein
MKRVFICSPFAGEIERNVEIAKKLCRMAMEQGYAPFAPHLLYPRFVDDFNPDERAAGINCGLSFMQTCSEVWAFMGNGISKGMKKELAHAREINKPIVEIHEV